MLSNVPKSASADPEARLRKEPHENSSTSNTLEGYLQEKGINSGEFSDVTITAFGEKYRLHRVILGRCHFFSCLLSERNVEQEGNDEAIHELIFNHDDQITPQSWDIILNALYGGETYKDITDLEELLSIFALATYLGFPQLIQSCREQIINKIA